MGPAPSSKFEKVDLEGQLKNGLLLKSHPIFRNRALERLGLRNNSLRELPAEIGDFYLLKMLDASHNDLSSLPQEIGRLDVLLDLHLSDNHLRFLPDTLPQLTCLSTLQLARNRLAEFPLPSCSLSSLVKLDLSENTIRRIPREIAGLRTLVELRLAKNVIAESLPESLCSLAELSVLDISCNRLTIEHFPDGFSQLTKLKRLDISKQRDGDRGCTLRELPPCVCFCRSLRELNMEGNPVLSPPDAFVQLRDDLVFLGELPDMGEGSSVVAVKQYVIANMSVPKIKSNCLQGLILGCSKAGKTTLVKSVVAGKPVPVAEEDRTFGIERIIWEPPEQDGLKIVFQDFAGQKDYYLTHQYFLSSGQLCIVAFDLAKYSCLSHGEHGYGELISNWIHASSAASRASNPVICLVATHVDLVSSTEDRERKLRHIIQQIEAERDILAKVVESGSPQTTPNFDNQISQLELFKSLPKTTEDIFCLSCNPESPEGIERLIGHILGLAAGLPEVCRLLPTTWMELRDRIIPGCRARNKENKMYPYMSLSELQEVAENDGLKMTFDNTKQAIAHLHMTGYIVHIELSQLSSTEANNSLANSPLAPTKHYVFLDPNWLMKFCRCIINHESPKNASDFFYLDISSLEFKLFVTELKRTGFMQHKFLKALLMKDSEVLGRRGTEANDLFAILLRMMRKFHLSFESKQGESDFMPWFLPTNRPPELNFSGKKPNGRQISAMVQFPTYFPIALFETLVVQCRPLLPSFDTHSEEAMLQWRAGSYSCVDGNHVLIETMQRSGTTEREIQFHILGQTDYSAFSLLAKLVSILDKILRVRWPGVYCARFITRPIKPHNNVTPIFEDVNQCRPVSNGNWNVWNIKSK